MLIWVKPKDLNWGCLLQRLCFFYTVLEGTSVDSALLNPIGRLRLNLHRSPVTRGLVPSCNAGLCICLQGFFAFYTCLLLFIAISAFCFHFVSRCLFRLNSPHFEDSRNTVKFFYAVGIILKQEGLLDYLINILPVVYVLVMFCTLCL